MTSPDRYQTKLLNGMAGDPAVQFFLPNSGEVFLFDLGSIENLTPKEVLKIRSVFVSHTHIDHFYGFDRLLRVNVPHFREVEVCGPEGLLKNVLGKLAGYNWNLLDPGQVRFVVREIAWDGTVSGFRISNETGFVPSVIEQSAAIQLRLPPPPMTPASTLTYLSGGLRVDAVALDHGISSIAYRCSFPGSYRVKTEALQASGFRPGPWIRELQIALNNEEHAANIVVEGTNHEAATLRDLMLEVIPSHSIGYVTDAIFSEENLVRAAALLQNIDLLICETNYHDDDRRKAFDKKHLTTTQAAALAHHVGATSLQTFHISNLYAERIDEIATHAATEFQRFSMMTPAERRTAISSCTQLI